MTRMNTEDGERARPVFGGLGSRVPGVGTRRTRHPWRVRGLTAAWPGMGHVLMGQAKRGPGLAFVMVLPGAITFQFTTPEQVFLGRFGGGAFLRRLAVHEVCKRARGRWGAFARAACAEAALS